MKNIFNYLLPFIFVIGCLISCSKNAKIRSVNYYENGKITKISLSAADKDKINKIISEFIYNSNDVLKLFVNEQLIESIKTEEAALEISWSSPQEIQSEEFGIHQLSLVLIPFSGDFIGNYEDPVITLFIGDLDGYITGPLRYSNGYAILMDLKRQLIN
ncbi:hypothetical protein ACFL46_00355 [Candidatus Neomarinimicrobiota bacterium]